MIHQVGGHVLWSHRYDRSNSIDPCWHGLWLAQAGILSRSLMVPIQKRPGQKISRLLGLCLNLFLLWDVKWMRFLQKNMHQNFPVRFRIFTCFFLNVCRCFFFHKRRWRHNSWRLKDFHGFHEKRNTTSRQVLGWFDDYKGRVFFQLISLLHRFCSGFFFSTLDLDGSGISGISITDPDNEELELGKVRFGEVKFWRKDWMSTEIGSIPSKCCLKVFCFWF